ncbi:hypothetical protein BCR34DRAFT_661282 [Clohesyomyces aquaticus]|uniref:DUF2293 domain-containing protein n=1 Tax=Clohesyomyces aquaticus TaxID=1231657 RepID=A0A1Y2A2K8_9PLEO|nr:hypothetical protein BCR34DRAFT_661282 [Clohesyomyces aquaticus]
MGRGGGHPTAPDRLQSNRAAHKRKTYQTILESVVDKKKILDAVWSFSKKPPPRYVYVHTTQESSRIIIASLERCRLRGLRVHQLSSRQDKSAKLQLDPNKIAHYSTPIGYYLPEGVVAEVCDDLGYAWDVDHKNELHLQSGSGGASLGTQNHEATREEITAAILHHVPKIPAEEVDKIINHAFKKGENRVGSAGNLSLIDRVNLAVQAHIRHTYTDYDKLLKQKEYKEARHEAEPGIVSVLKKWRNLDDNGELEEGFREVVVLDDDDATSKDEGNHESGVVLREGFRGLEQMAAPARSTRHPDDVDTDILGPGNGVPRVPPLRRPLSPAHPTNSSYLDHRKIRYEPVFGPSSNVQPAFQAPKPATRQNARRALLADGVLYNLQPVDSSMASPQLTTSVGRPVAQLEPDPHMLQFVPPSSRVRRPVEEVYQQPFPMVVPSRYATPQMRSPPAAPRRQSEQDIVLPSVEREAQSPYSLRSPNSRPNNNPRPLVRRYNPDEIVDLTSSPRHNGGGRGEPSEYVRVVSRPETREVLPLYSPVPPRAPRPSDVRGIYYEEPTRGVRSAQMPESHRTVYGYPPAVPRLHAEEQYPRPYPPVVEPGYVRSDQQRY